MPHTPLRVLLVDTDRHSVRQISALLAESTPVCELIVADTWRKGIDMLLNGRFDSALVRHELGLMTGIDLLREVAGTGRTTPVILLSDCFDPSLDAEAIAAGADDYLCCDELTPRLLIRSIRYASERVDYRTHLKTSEHRLRAVISHAPVVLFASDADGTVTLAEGKGLTSLGPLAERLLHTRIDDIFPPDSGVVSNIERARSGESFNAVVEVNGAYFDCHYSPVVDTAGDLSGVFGVAVDITERILAEQAVQEREKRFRLMVENASDITLLLDQHGVIRYSTPSSQRVVGHPPETLIGRDIVEILHPDDHATVWEGFREKFRPPGAVAQVTVRLHHIDGTWKLLEGIATNLVDDPAVGAIIFNARDITDRIWVERERDQLLAIVQYESESLEALITGIPGAVWERRGGADPLSHRITFMSDYIETMLGYTSREFRAMKRDWIDLVYPEDRQKIVATITGHTPPGTYHFTYRIRARDGRIVWIDSNVVSSINEDGEIIERGISLDITEQRRAEEALRESEERFRVAIKASSLSVFSMDRDLRYTWGYNTVVVPAHQIIGRQDRDLVDEKTATMLTAIKQKVLDTGRGTHEEISLERNGRRHYFDMVIEPLRDHDDEVVGITLAAFDVTSIRSAEEELRRSQELFRTFMENSPALAFIKDERDRYIFTNRNVSLTPGREMEDLLGITDAGMVSAEDAARYRRSDREVLDTGVAVSALESFGPPENRRYWYSVRFPILSSEGERMVGAMLVDVTERIAAEQSLRLSEERFQLATRATSDVILDWDMTTGTMWMSGNIATVYGYPPEELEPGLEWWIERIDPDQKKDIREGLDAVIAGGGEFWTAEYRFRRWDGSYADVLNRGYIVHDVNGTPTRMVGAMIDISSQKHAEQALRESQSRLQALFEHAQDTILLADDAGRYIDVNPAACALTGYSRDEMLGLGIFDLAEPELRERVMPGWKHFIATGEQHGDFRLVRKDGSVIDTEFRAVANIVPGLHLSVMRDTTERILAERMLKEANDELERRVEERTAEIVRVMRRLEQTNITQKRFIADASHDLRTPLTVLRAELDLMLRETEEPELLATLGRLAREAQRLDTLITDLLMLATLEGRSIQIPHRPVRIDELMLDSASQLRPLANEKQIAWRIRADEPIEIACDEMTIKRMLTNVMENAVKYSHHNGIVEVALTRIPADNGRPEVVEIVVRDNGAGIAAQDLSRVFDRFYRGDVTRSTPGTGLGLAIVKAAAEAHGGEVAIESTVDIGTTVTVRLRTGEYEAGDAGFVPAV